MNVNERIRYIRTQMRLSQKEFAQKLGIDNTTVSRWQKDGYRIKEDRLIAISNRFGVSLQWLKTGQEPIWAPDSLTEQKKIFLKKRDKLSPLFQNALDELLESLLKLQQKAEQKED